MTSIKVPKQDQKKEGIEMNESSETAHEHYLTEFKRKTRQAVTLATRLNQSVSKLFSS